MSIRKVRATSVKSRSHSGNKDRDLAFLMWIELQYMQVAATTGLLFALLLGIWVTKFNSMPEWPTTAGIILVSFIVSAALRYFGLKSRGLLG